MALPVSSGYVPPQSRRDWYIQNKQANIAQDMSEFQAARDARSAYDNRAYGVAQAQWAADAAAKQKAAEDAQKNLDELKRLAIERAADDRLKGLQLGESRSWTKTGNVSDTYSGSRADPNAADKYPSWADVTAVKGDGVTTRTTTGTTTPGGGEDGGVDLHLDDGGGGATKEGTTTTQQTGAISQEDTAQIERVVRQIRGQPGAPSEAEARALAPVVLASNGGLTSTSMLDLSKAAAREFPGGPDEYGKQLDWLYMALPHAVDDTAAQQMHDLIAKKAVQPDLGGGRVGHSAGWSTRVAGSISEPELAGITHNYQPLIDDAEKRLAAAQEALKTVPAAPPPPGYVPPVTRAETTKAIAGVNIFRGQKAAAAGAGAPRPVADFIAEAQKAVADRQAAAAVNPAAPAQPAAPPAPASPWGPAADAPQPPSTTTSDVDWSHPAIAQAVAQSHAAVAARQQPGAVASRPLMQPAELDAAVGRRISDAQSAVASRPWVPGTGAAWHSYIGEQAVQGPAPATAQVAPDYGESQQPAPPAPPAPGDNIGTALGPEFQSPPGESPNYVHRGPAPPALVPRESGASALSGEQGASAAPIMAKHGLVANNGAVRKLKAARLAAGADPDGLVARLAHEGDPEALAELAKSERAQAIYHALRA